MIRKRIFKKKISQIFSRDGKFRTLSIDATSESDPLGTLNSYLITWGDGTTSTTAVASRTYATDDTFNYSVEVTSVFGVETQTGIFVSKSAPPAPSVPVPNFTWTSALLVASFDSSASTGDYDSLHWEWNDGTSNGSGTSPDHEFPESGFYYVSLVLTKDGVGFAYTEKVTVSMVVVVPIPEPNTGLAYNNIMRAFELPSGLQDTIPNTGTLSDWTASGSARPTATGEWLEFDGVANEIQQSTATESNWLTDGGDWVIQLIFQASEEFATGTHRIFATYDGTTGVYFQVAAGTLRIYGFGTASDNSPLSGIIWDNRWICVTMVFDSNTKDIFKYVNNITAKDSNWALTPIVADQDHPLTIGSGIGTAFSLLRLKDFRSAPITYVNYDYAKYALPYYAWAVKYEHIEG